MKKKVYKILATAIAMAFVVASPATSMTTHAQGFNADAPEHADGDGRRPDNLSWDNSGSTSSSSSNSSSSSSGSSSSGGSSDNGNTSPDNSATVSNPNDVTVGVTGGQKFRIVMNNEHTSYQIYHCGISKITFNVTDTEDNIVAYKTIMLEKDENGLWYANITVNDNIDTKDLTVNVLKGDETYLGTELGVRGVKVNGEVRLLTCPTSGFNADAPMHADGDGKKPSNN